MAIEKPQVDTLTLTTFSIEQLRETVKGGDFEHVQLSSGPFRGHLLRSEFGGNVLDTGIYSQDLLVRGTLSEDRVTLGYILKGSRAGYFNDKRLAMHDIIVISEGGAMEPYRLPADTQWVSFQTQRDILEREGIPLPVRGNLAVHPGFSSESLQLGQLVQEIITPAQTHEPALNGGGAKDGVVLEDAIIAAFRGAIDASQDTEPRLRRPRPNKYMRMLRQIEEFIECNLKNEIRIPELCAEIGTSQRTLEYLFKDYYSMSPRQYLTLRRLNAVRQCLLEAGPRDVSIASVAARFNFNHPGRFARTYLKLFAELPSATLSSLKQTTTDRFGSNR
jgi:AraC family ethanolamine operon transcriptional activator